MRGTAGTDWSKKVFLGLADNVRLITKELKEVIRYKGTTKGQEIVIISNIIKDKKEFSGVGDEEELQNFIQFLAKYKLMRR
ncbi:hypothetical protein [Floridanema fluviatile]|uniref:hypothetical protein n=1 Tax=Floridanema fluviatile TaxID=3396171 RepID=UPI0039A63924